MILEHKGIPIFYEDSGKGSAIVLLHGLLENSSMWNSITPELSKTHRVVTIDLLGHGQTGSLGYVHSMETMAEAVHTVLKSLRLRRVIFIGHSMGGYVSLAFAEKYPKMIKGLCLMNSTTKPDTTERIDLRKKMIFLAKTADYKNVIRILVKGLFRKESLTTYKSAVDSTEKEALRTSRQGFIAAQQGISERTDKTDFFVKGSFKKLVIIGKDDSVVDNTKLLRLAKQNNIEATVLEGGHMSHIENKEALITALKAFCKDC